MKIAIVNTAAPFIYGGAEFLADNLKEKLIESGYEAELIRIPFDLNTPSGVLEQILACRFIDLRIADLVIALKFPVYYVRHRNKTLWLLHQLRQMYDLWGTPLQGIPDTPEWRGVREAVIRADNEFLGEVKHIYTNGKVVSDRLKRFNNIDSEVLVPPLLNPERFSCGAQGDYLFYPSRLGAGKRQALAIEAMRYCKSEVKLVVAGSPDYPQYLEECRSLIERFGLEDRVVLKSTFISEKEKEELLANCLGCLYLSFLEDSWGYVTIEAYYSSKPVITCLDSGGPLEVVLDGETGFAVAPEPEALAEAMDRLYMDRNSAARMGTSGYRRLKDYNSWPNVIRKLVEECA